MRPRPAPLAVVTFAVFATLALVAPPLSAQGPGPRGREGGPSRDPSHGRHGRSLGRHLDLTSGQAAAARDLREVLEEKVHPLRDEIHAARDGLKAELDSRDPAAVEVGELVLRIHASVDGIKAARAEFDRAFAALLTADQRARYESMKEALEVMKGPRGDRGDVPGRFRGFRPRNPRR